MTKSNEPPFEQTMEYMARATLPELESLELRRLDETSVLQKMLKRRMETAGLDGVLVSRLMADIAEVLRMGTVAYVARGLREMRRSKAFTESGPAPKELLAHVIAITAADSEQSPQESQRLLGASPTREEELNMRTESLREDEADAIVDRVIEKLPLDQLASIVAEKLPLNLLAEKLAGRMGAPASVAALSGDVLDAVSDAISPSTFMEPFFQQSQTAQSILRLLPVSHKRKWTFFFSDWGCVRCQRGENEGVAHGSNGLCRVCYPLIAQWLKESVKKRVEAGAPTTAEEAISRHRRRPLTSEDLDQLTPDTIMEPWFLDKQTESAIAQLVPLSKRRKWIYFFLDHGCLRCARKDRKHHCLGLCKRCYLWINYHLRASINKHHTQNGPTPEDLTAKLALRASTAQRIFAGEEVLPAKPQAEAATERASPWDWKQRLGRGCARIIDALTNRGELSTNEIASITGLTLRTVQDNLDVLRRNTLVETRYGRHVLRKPCEECRQVRQTLFHGKGKKSVSEEEQKP
jgi:hypothetical protein